MSKFTQLATELEKERVFYGVIKDFSQLSDAKSITTIEQCQIVQDVDGDEGFPIIIRARAYNDKNFEMTIKRPATKTEDAVVESNVKIDKDMYLVFKSITQTINLKKRYVFTIPGSKLIWEVDVSYGKGGKVLPLAKLDIEGLPKGADVPPFPIELENPFELGLGKDADAEKVKIVDKFYKKDALTINPNGLHKLREYDLK